ncbi:MAG: GT-D fold domain-containing glycosyltransferase [Candidatus Omnitrophica bacterium]|nr:GT-D fold domain-containing glycosyltransferase [Candidatus Omnitrophota bacterium]
MKGRFFVYQRVSGQNSFSCPSELYRETLLDVVWKDSEKHNMFIPSGKKNNKLAAIFRRRCVPAKPLIFLDREKTLEHAFKEGLSLVRYGDGEFNLMFLNHWRKSRACYFQSPNVELSSKLKEILIRRNANVLPCINHQFMNNEEHRVVLDYERTPKKYYKLETVKRKDDIGVLKRFKEKQYYRRIWMNIKNAISHETIGDATCFILGYYYREYKENRIDEVTSLYRNFLKRKKVLFVCPQAPLMGNSFKNLHHRGIIQSPSSIEFLFIPNNNAYHYYRSIKRKVLRYKRLDAVFIQSGPTATVLAADLGENHGLLSYDVGSWNVSLEKAAVIDNLTF